MGSDDPQFPDARPWHRVWVDGFHMDKTLVTNAEYAAFVHATGYVTVAEQIPNAKDYPGAPAEKLVAGSIVFAPPAKAVPLNNQYQWWDFVKGANWRHPEGTKSDLRGRLNHPVVQVAYDDGIAYYSGLAAGSRLRRNLNMQPVGAWSASVTPGATSFGPAGHGQHLSRPLSGEQHRRGRLCQYFSGGIFSSEQLRPL